MAGQGFSRTQPQSSQRAHFISASNPVSRLSCCYLRNVNQGVLEQMAVENLAAWMPR